MQNPIVQTKTAALKNHFRLSEWSGAVGDLGTTLPLAFALVVYNGFPAERIFFLWGLVYVATGFFFRVPLAVQPLKAMAVIAISLGYSWPLLSSTAFFYGMIFLLLVASGLIDWLQGIFTPALVRGIQLGIGLLLAYKAVGLIVEKSFLLNPPAQVEGTLLQTPAFNLLLAALVVLLLALFQFRRNLPLVLPLLLLGLCTGLALGGEGRALLPSGSPMELTVPRWSFFPEALIFLIIPQLPLTLGNAVYAAADACCIFWPERSGRISARRLATSIGLSNVGVGLLGGFPICHGAGGIGAHAQFGGKTGGTTIIIGSIFVLLALIKPLASFIFWIPVPLLAAMLLADSWRMMTLIRRLQGAFPLLVALLVGLLSFLTRNLTIALLAGLLVERGYPWLNRQIQKRKHGDSP